jgi:glycosyltransferase 2 family protein
MRSTADPAGSELKAIAEAQPYPPGDRSPNRHRRQALVWISGLLILAAVIAAALHFSELRRFAELAREAEPIWLVVAGLCQVATYVCATAVWHQTLREAGTPRRLAALVPLGLAKLFTDQALPSGGISGTLLVIGGLARRGVPTRIGMAALLVGLVSFYAAYLIAVSGALAILWRHHAVGPILLAGVSVLCVIAAGVPAAVLVARRWARPPLLSYLDRIPGLAALLQSVAEAPADLLQRPRLVAIAILLQLAIFLLDAVTLWSMLRAIGETADFSVAFAAFMAATVAATVGPVPLGLGTFEAVSVAMLNQLGISLEPSLAATLLLRGFTFWLPMLPGLWLARRELGAR